MLAYLADGRGVFVFALIGRNEIQNSLVAFAQTFAFSDHHHFKPPAR
jgi:hypothetical protein